MKDDDYWEIIFIKMGFDIFLEKFKYVDNM